MKFQLFGKTLFEIKKSRGGIIYNTAIDQINRSEFLPDFYRDTGAYMGLTESVAWNYEVVNGSGSDTKSAKKRSSKKVVAEAPKPELTPKDVYQLKTLNDESFAIKTDPAYVDEQIDTFQTKLGMIKSQEFDMNRGTVEIGSMLIRMQNRKKYPQHEGFFSEFPYTTTAKINELTKTHDYLKLGEVSQFLADMPKDAVDVMKKYTTEVKKLCDKKPAFYIIANKKDFEKSDKRRDPILLAQSPFGHFWQILGAWDEEMLLIEEL